ncbi:hypothetical protein PAT3040_01955 [Paenibacillus agaridevorans]|uniref:Uncharacterized protein n=1 Tax=Paenibacillus agaridevorans TaxID=171404 RepID=A0A2R5EMR2_9BACL|nr:hypothetical protein [Paenibacillus agaridevorans]GBG07405.1 hypothetical protein PAT3040_01955 [Paenibacillus agaridevorans]
MTSFIWGRSPQEAYENPYEYEAQDQFAREAEVLVSELFEFLMKKNGKYPRDDRSSEKAVWMLFVDGVETIKDCLELVNSRRHRLACRLFRDVIETIDLATYFSSSDKDKDSHLNNWYNNKVIPNRVFRNFIANTAGESISRAYRNIYSDLSRLNHRTYRSLAYSYLLRKQEFLVYEGEYKNRQLTLPQPVAMCYALLADVILKYSDRMLECSLITFDEVSCIWSKALENEIVPRRFMTRDDYKRMFENNPGRN